MRGSAQKLLLVYSTVVSTVLLCVVLIGAKKPGLTELDELRVHRIDVVEPDGTMRMVISDRDRLPPIIIRSKDRAEVGEARPQAGMIFYNDEGKENGGLLFGGKKNAEGQVVNSGGSLSFDKYGAGQNIELAGVDDKDNQYAGLAVSQGGQRVWIGHTSSGVASVSLTDASGRNRIVMQVAKDGTPSLGFFDANGRLIQELAPKQ